MVANHKSAKKRARQTIVRTLRNKVQTSQTRTAIKKLREAIENKDKGNAATLLTAAQSLTAKLAQTGIIKANTAARRVGRLAAQVARL